MQNLQLFENFNGNFCKFSKDFEKIISNFSRKFGQKYRKILGLYISSGTGDGPPKDSEFIKNLVEKSMKPANFASLSNFLKKFSNFSQKVR